MNALLVGRRIAETEVPSTDAVFSTSSTFGLGPLRFSLLLRLDASAPAPAGRWPPLSLLEGEELFAAVADDVGGGGERRPARAEPSNKFAT